MQLTETDTRPEERRVSPANFTSENNRKNETIVAPVPVHSQVITGSNDSSNVVWATVAIAFSLVVIHFLMALGQQVLLYMLAKMGIFAGSSTIGREAYGVGMFLFSTMLVVAVGFIIGTVADRRAIVPVIIAGHLFSQTIYFVFVYPRMLAAIHAPLPATFLGQILLGTVTSLVTEIAIALLVASQKNKPTTSYQNMAR